MMSDPRNEIQYLRSSLSRERKRNIFLGVVLFVSVLANWKQSGNVISTIIPPVVHQSFWVSHDSMSPEYLEEMSTWVAMLSSNYTPKSIDYSFDKIKNLAAPEYYGVLDVELEKKKQFVKKNAISSTLHISDVSINQDKSFVVIHGIKQSWIGDKKLPDQNISIKVAFEYTAGYVRLSLLEETDWEGKPLKEEGSK